MLTHTQHQAMLTIQKHMKERQVFPTRAELAGLLFGDFNKRSSAQRLIDGLVSRGFLKRLPMSKGGRNIEIIKPVPPVTEYYKFDFETGKFTKIPDP